MRNRQIVDGYASATKFQTITFHSKHGKVGSNARVGGRPPKINAREGLPA
jgi:hypothetical protein